MTDNFKRFERHLSRLIKEMLLQMFFLFLKVNFLTVVQRVPINIVHGKINDTLCMEKSMIFWKVGQTIELNFIADSSLRSCL